MKNNDLDNFDFIKSKFDESSFDVPNTLDENEIKKKILSKENHKVVKFENKKRIKFMPIISAAACFVIVFGVVFASNINKTNNSNNSNNLNKIMSFQSYDEISNFTNNLEHSSGKTEMGAGYKTISKYDFDDNKPDIVKTYGNYIFYSYFDSNNDKDRNKIYIYKTDAKKVNLVAILDDFDLDDDFQISNLIVSDDRLIVNISGSLEESLIKIYDISNPEKPVYMNDYKQSGFYVDSKIINGVLYTVSNYYCEDNSIPISGFNGKIQKLSPKDIGYFTDSKYAEYAVISALNISTVKESSNTKAIIGSFPYVHFSENNIFLFEGEQIYSEDADFVVDKSNQTKNDTNIVKIEIKNDDMKLSDLFKLQGVITKSSLIDEKDGVLRILTISNKNVENSFVNKLYTLDLNLNVLGSVDGGFKENYIDAVYIDNYAYVYTGSENSFVYVFDLSNPKNITLNSKTSVETDKIPDLVIPINDNKVITVNEPEEVDGDEIFIYETSNNGELTILDHKKMNDVYTEVTVDYQALAINKEKGYFAMPCYTATKTERKYGVVTFEIKNDKIVLTNKFINNDDNLMYDGRCVIIGDYIYSFDINDNMPRDKKLSVFSYKY